MVLLSITPLPDGVLQLDIIAPFHTSGPPLLQFHLDIEQWGKILGDTVNLKIINFPVSFNECFGGLALFNGDPVAAAEYATITDITNTNFKIYMYANNAGTGYANANIFYLFLGA
ncbi:hypothetical protein PFJ30894_01244 [Phascolarctobacterium faecium]|nr:hypothetical protein PFJ30894_01244 [Phascolarctobacterium faecium]